MCGPWGPAPIMGNGWANEAHGHEHKVFLFSRPGFLWDLGQVTPPPKPHEIGEGATLGSPDLKPRPGTLSPSHAPPWLSSECTFKAEGWENNAENWLLAASPRAEQKQQVEPLIARPVMSLEGLISSSFLNQVAPKSPRCAPPSPPPQLPSPELHLLLHVAFLTLLNLIFSLCFP